MVVDTELHVLRAADPAAQLAPLAEHERLALRDEAMSVARPLARRQRRRARRIVQLGIALAVLGVITAGIAWAAGGAAPLSLFEMNPQGTMQNSMPGVHWDETPIAGSVKQVATVDIPKVGQVVFWYAPTKQGGWCSGLRLSNGEWIGFYGTSPGDGVVTQGPVPGCFPIQENTAYGVPGRGLGMDWHRNYIDATHAGGAFWSIVFGLITVPGAVKVTDLTSGQSTDLIDGDLFILPIQGPDVFTTPNTPVPQLVAYDKAGNIVADNCPRCSDG